MVALKVSIPLTALMLCLLECYAYGRRDELDLAGLRERDGYSCRPADRADSTGWR